jgi:hypothetical protein
MHKTGDWEEVVSKERETPIEVSIARVRRTQRTLSILAIAVGVFGLSAAGSAVWLATHEADAPAAVADASSAATDYDDSGNGSYGGSQNDEGGGIVYDEYEPMDGWTALDEQAVLNAIESHPIFDDYDPYCVLGVIQGTYDSLNGFGLAAQDPAEMRSLGHDVVSACSVAASY